MEVISQRFTSLGLKIFDGASFASEVDGRWLRQNTWLSLVVSVVYLVVVFGGKRWMSERSPFDLRRLLVLWSSSFALFSFLGMVVTARDFIRVIKDDGWNVSICQLDCFDGEVGLWMWLFTISKVLELGDTVFIVLRKQRLLFLHWYHHVSTLVYTWYAYRDWIALGRYFATLNFGVHFVMYTYYALTAAKVIGKAPHIKVGITLLQLVQFFISIIVTIYAATQLWAGNPCSTNWSNIAWCSLLYLSFFYFFIQFFVDSYLKPKQKQKL